MAGYGPGALLFDEEERRELLEVMEQGYLHRYSDDDDVTFKHKVYDFELELAKYMGIGYCVAVNSGTSAMLCALAALGIGPGTK